MTPAIRELPRGTTLQRDSRIEHRPQARLARKGLGKEAKLCYSGNALIENRDGLLVSTFRSSTPTGRPSGASRSRWLIKRVEKIFGWIKTVTKFRRTRYRGHELTQLAAYLVVAAWGSIAQLSAAVA